ncbi:hypothetical protein SLEP1_g57503 [Rubroshorea leprosula]|uniref:Uncharacterized protein n=1 Tax=Rubroshorea leprosula TaxID=152421 RepID=A0AAV5MQF5_9ROSI|nr:hypothetical protein SLEP1_g57503 [Rubroshorea leprosula]
MRSLGGGFEESVLENVRNAVFASVEVSQSFFLYAVGVICHETPYVAITS